MAINLALEAHPENDLLTAEALNAGAQVYPEHIYDETRVNIAAQILGKEVAKLVVAPDDTELARHRELAKGWFDGADFELSPAHDFWSTFDQLLSVKTKRLARFVTAQNVRWDMEEMPLEELTLTWMPFVKAKPELYGEAPWPISRLKQVFRDHPDEHAYARTLNDRIKTRYSFDRSDDPITVVTRHDGEQYLLDGNGRLGTAWIDERPSIKVWHGKMEGERLLNHWVSTGPLKDLCYTVAFEAEENPEVADAALTLLRHQLSTNEIARVNYHIWIKEHFPQLTELLADVLY